MKRKGLVIIYDPHSLQQFVWYYCTFAHDTEWDALCLPNGYKGTYMQTFCKDAGLFNNVFSDDVDLYEIGYREKLLMVLEMMAYAVVGKKEKYAMKELNKHVFDLNQYDELAALCDTGFYSGLFALFAKNKKVVYFDDGIGDYVERKSWKCLYSPLSKAYWQCIVMNKLGYGCKGRLYFKPTQNCIKYSSNSKEMKYLNYKEMYDFDTTCTNTRLYDSILEKVYPEVNHIDYDSVDAVFFTDDLNVFTDDYQDFYFKACEYIGKRHKKVLLKKHPRDNGRYSFGDDVVVQEISNAVPAEIILDRIVGKKIYFTYFCSLILFMKQYNLSYTILYPVEIYEKNHCNSSWDDRMLSIEETKTLCERFNPAPHTIIELN